MSQHESLRLLIDRLLVITAAPRGVISEPRLRRLLQREISQFRVELLQHFTHEEETGFFKEFQGYRQSVAGRIGELMEQHKMLAAQFEDLVGMAGTGDLDDLSRRIVALLDELRAHEHAEIDLLQEALLTDIGAAD